MALLKVVCIPVSHTGSIERVPLSQSAAKNGKSRLLLPSCHHDISHVCRVLSDRTKGAAIYYGKGGMVYNNISAIMGFASFQGVFYISHWGCVGHTKTLQVAIKWDRRHFDSMNKIFSQNTLCDPPQKYFAGQNRWPPFWHRFMRTLKLLFQLTL